MDLTNLMSAAFSIAFICAALDPLPLEIALICSDFFFDSSVARFAMRKFQCSFLTSGGLGDPASISEFNLQRTVIKTLVMRGPNHFSLIFFWLPLISQSASAIMQHYKKHCFSKRIPFWWSTWNDTRLLFKLLTSECHGYTFPPNTASYFFCAS